MGNEFLDIDLIVGDKFHHPKDQFGIEVDYQLKEITMRDEEYLYHFEPLKKTYEWYGQKYSFDVFNLKRDEVIALLNKKFWIKK